MYVRKYTTKLVLNSWLSFDWNTYNYVHISSTIEIYSGVLRSTLRSGESAFFYSGEPEWRKHKIGGSPQHCFWYLLSQFKYLSKLPVWRRGVRACIWVAIAKSRALKIFYKSLLLTYLNPLINSRSRNPNIDFSYS